MIFYKKENIPPQKKTDEKYKLLSADLPSA